MRNRNNTEFIHSIFYTATFVHHSNDGNVVIATEPGSFDGISMATISHAPPAMTTDQQLAALSQFASNMQSHHVTDHDQPTLYVLEDPSAGHHDDDHQHVSFLKSTVSPAARCDFMPSEVQHILLILL
jgi:hypothetical protein